MPGVFGRGLIEAAISCLSHFRPDGTNTGDRGYCAMLQFPSIVEEVRLVRHEVLSPQRLIHPDGALNMQVRIP